MIRVLKNLFHRPAIKMGRVDNSLIHTTRLRNAQFVSFISETGSLMPFSSTDRYDARLRRRKMMKAFLATGVAAGAAWIVIESAHALTMF
jgi:hypothetical protein